MKWGPPFFVLARDEVLLVVGVRKHEVNQLDVVGACCHVQDGHPVMLLGFEVGAELH